MVKSTRRSGVAARSAPAIDGGLGPQIDRLQVDLGPGKPGQAQESGDELRHLLAGGLDPFGVSAALVAERRPEILQQRRGVTIHGPERSTQVVGDREREGLQSLIGLLQIPRALLGGDVPLECLAALAFAPGIEPVQGVAAFSVLGRLGLVLGGPGPAALDVGLDVDPPWASWASRRWCRPGYRSAPGPHARHGAGYRSDPGPGGRRAARCRWFPQPDPGRARGLHGSRHRGARWPLIDLGPSRRALVSRSSQSSLRHQRDRPGRPLDGGTGLPSKARGQQSRIEEDQPAIRGPESGPYSTNS